MSPEQSAFASLQLVDSEVVPLFGPNDLTRCGVIRLSVIFGESVRWHSEGEHIELRRLPVARLLRPTSLVGEHVSIGTSNEWLHSSTELEQGTVINSRPHCALGRPETRLKLEA